MIGPLRHPLRQLRYLGDRHCYEPPETSDEERQRSALLRLAGILHANDTPGGES